MSSTKTTRQAAATPGAPSPGAASQPWPGQRWRHARRTVGRWVHGLPLGRRVALLVLLAGVILVISVIVSSVAVVNLNDSMRQQVDRVDPATVAAAQYSAALVDEESGVRGYLLSGNATFLEPYQEGVGLEQLAYAQLRQDLRGDGRLEADLAAAAAAASRWSDQFAKPTIAAVSGGRRATITAALIDDGTALFDRFRAEMSVLSTGLASAHAAADANLSDADHLLVALLGICLLAVLAVFEVTWVLVRRWITAPIVGLADDVRAVSAGAYDHQIIATGSPEVRALAADVDAMRGRILSNLVEVEASRQALAEERTALEHSNKDLEQFAYLASHDLQEPLRKISSFSELVLRRYSGDLDERGREFLTFIADGARRMQRLIEDVLELSKVGRSGRPFAEVDLNEVFDAARADLAGPIESSGAVVTSEALPRVQGDQALLVVLFENLVSNSLKFHSSLPPHVNVTAALLNGEAGSTTGRRYWRITVEDNGLGIPPEHAERIFGMFQRLRPRADFPGTGIGLAICQRIVEHHGGRIFVEAPEQPGTRLVFTLPAEADRRRRDGAG